MVPLPHQHELVYIPAAEFDRLVWEEFCVLLTHPEQITTALMRARGGVWLPQELEARRTLVRQGRDSLQRQLERLTEAYLGE